MGRLIKEAFLLILILSILATFVSAQSINIACPESVTVGETFTITATAEDPAGVNSIALIIDGRAGNPSNCDGSLSSCTKEFSIIAQDREMSFKAVANTNGDESPLITEYGCSIQPDTTPPEIVVFEVNQPSTDIITIRIKATDNKGISNLQYFIQGTDKTETYTTCGGTSCEYTWSLTLSPGTYKIYAKAKDTSANNAQDLTKSITVTSSNSPPTFSTTQSYFDNNPATQNQKYTAQIQASDPEGDPIAYSMTGAPSDMSLGSSTGILAWSNPLSSTSVNIGIKDPTNYIVSQSFTIPVIACPLGQTQPCGPPTDAGECNFGTQTCNGVTWGQCTGAVYPKSEICGNCIDENCDGVKDDSCKEICDNIDNNCNGQIDDGCDDDIDGYCDSTLSCIETYFKCESGRCLDCDDENKNISPSKTEICNLRDDNCDGITDGKDICTCSIKEVFETTSKAEIIQPADGGNYYIGEPVAFYAREKEGAEIKDYRWDLGDGQSSFDQKSVHTYANKGDYQIKLTYFARSTKYKNECEKTASISIHVLGCLKDADCGTGKACKSGICMQQNATMAEVPFTITINSPSNQVYAQKTVPLSIMTSKPATCSYSLNDGDQVIMLPGTNSVEGREGLNTLKVSCANSTASAQFTVKTEVQTTSLMEDVKGDVKGKPGESLLGMFKDRRTENPLSEEEAQNMLSETAELGEFLEVGKSLQQTSAGSIIMLSVKNKAMFRMDAKIDVTIPKSIANSASELKGDFMVIEDDPVIEFDISNLSDEQTLLIEVSKAIDSGQLDGIGISAKEDLGLMLSRQKETDKAMDIKIETQETKVDGKTVTRIRTYIEPKKNMEGVALIQNIPKCLAKQIDYLKMDERYRSQIKIINPDPLIMWQFEEITSEKYFEYEVKGILSEDCRKQIKSLGIADELGLDIESRDYFSIILPLMVIPLLGLVVVRLHKFSNVMKKKEKDKIKTEKPEEKPIEQKKPEEKKLRMIEKSEDEGKFLQKEIEEAEEEFKRRLKS